MKTVFCLKMSFKIDHMSLLLLVKKYHFTIKMCWWHIDINSVTTCDTAQTRWKLKAEVCDRLRCGGKVWTDSWNCSKSSTSQSAVPPPGPQRELGGDPPQRAARAGDGRHDGGVLPGLLAALRSDGSARDLRPPWLSEPRGHHHAVTAGQVLHRHQPVHLHIHE